MSALSNPRQFLVSGVACGLLAAVPFLLVTFPPITDLPQQTAQIALLADADENGYRVQAWHPNKLGYLPLALAWELTGPLAAGRLGLLLIVLMWIAAIHALAHAVGRPASVAVLASLFVFNQITYWGFLNFLIGLPAFVVWYLIVRSLGARPDDAQKGAGLRLLGAGLLLYSAHVLWLAAGLAWLAVVTLLDDIAFSRVLRRFAWLLPIGGAVAVWYLSFSTSGVDERTFWGHAPWQRLQPSWLLNAAFGGLYGRVEPAVALGVLAWLVLSLWQHRSELSTAIDRRLALLGGLFLLAALLLPGVTRHTILFASRWMPVAAVFLVLACPAPRLRRPLGGAVAWLLAITLVAATAAAWMGFEQEELNGFSDCLAAVPEDGRVLGLSLIKTSPRIRGFPYYHLVAYSQVLHGSELNRTFADEASSLVVFSELPHTYAWTDRLDWRPEQFRQSDRDHFDFILVHATPDAHAFFLRDPDLRPLTAQRPWRLYRATGPE